MTDHTTEDALWRECLDEGATWMPGMLATDRVAVAFRLVGANAGGWWGHCGSDTRTALSLIRVPLSEMDCTPAWTDDATIGALLGAVRRVWKDPTISARCLARYVDGEWVDGPWVAQTMSAHVLMPIADNGATEPEALLRALLAGLRREAE